MVEGVPFSFRASERTLLGSAAMGRGPERYACLGLARVLARGGKKELTKGDEPSAVAPVCIKRLKGVFRPIKLVVLEGRP